MDTAQWLERCSGCSYKAYSVSPIARKMDSKLFVPLLLLPSTRLIYNRQAMGRGQNRDTPIQGNTVLFFPVPCSSFCPCVKYETWGHTVSLFGGLKVVLLTLDVYAVVFAHCGVMEREHGTLLDKSGLQPWLHHLQLWLWESHLSLSGKWIG